MISDLGFRISDLGIWILGFWDLVFSVWGSLPEFFGEAD
jgi:hypothetical protein